jgi:hypothetical protein
LREKRRSPRSACWPSVPTDSCFCKVCCFEQTAKSACGTKDGVRVGLSSSAQGVVSVPPSHPPRPGQLPSCSLSLHTAISALTIAIRSRRTPSRRPAAMQRSTSCRNRGLPDRHKHLISERQMSPDRTAQNRWLTHRRRRGISEPRRILRYLVIRGFYQYL